HLKNAESTYQQLVAYRNAIGDTQIPVFLVTPSESENVELPFDLHVFDNDGRLIKSDFSLFPTFPALTAEDAAERKSVLRSKKSRITSSFQNVSWSLAF
ncbi:hypothetical protein JZU68_09010, partial [bacterium]|nr:hypothetical protein [bacterium]